MLVQTFFNFWSKKSTIFLKIGEEIGEKWGSDHPEKT
jgi:hypothetical protein